MSAPTLFLLLPFYPSEWKHCSLSASCDSPSWRETSSLPFTLLFLTSSQLKLCVCMCVCVGVLPIVNPCSSLTLGWMRVLYELCAGATTTTGMIPHQLTNPWALPVGFLKSTRTTSTLEVPPTVVKPGSLLIIIQFFLNIMCTHAL